MPELKIYPRDLYEKTHVKLFENVTIVSCKTKEKGERQKTKDVIFKVSI